MKSSAIVMSGESKYPPSSAWTPRNEFIRLDPDHMVVADSSPSHMPSIVSRGDAIPDIWGSSDQREVKNSRDRELHSGSPLDRPNEG